MTYFELKIQLDLLNKKDRLNFIKQNLPYFKKANGKTFAVCDDGDCHLFNRYGNECDINKVKEIEEFRCNYENLKTIKIPNNVISIMDWAFSGCISLTSVTIPNNVTNIGKFTFKGCDNLKEVIFKSKTLSQIKEIKCYPWGIEDESIIKCI